MSKYKGLEIVRHAQQTLKVDGVLQKPVHYRFEDCFFETDDQEVDTYLQGLKTFGTDFWLVDKKTVITPPGAPQIKVAGMDSQAERNARQGADVDAKIQQFETRMNEKLDKTLEAVAGLVKQLAPAEEVKKPKEEKKA